jgi:hypothetical protein
MTVREALYNKLSAEYAEFIDRLKFSPPTDIIDAAYEKTFKEDIVSCFEYGVNLNRREIAALLVLDRPLDELYRNWLDTDVSHMDDLSDSIRNFAIRENERRRGPDKPSISEQLRSVHAHIAQSPQNQNREFAAKKRDDTHGFP